MRQHEDPSAGSINQPVHFVHPLKDHALSHLFVRDPVAIDRLDKRIAELVIKIFRYARPLCVALLGKRERKVFRHYFSPIPRYIIEQRIEDIVRYPVVHAERHATQKSGAMR